MKSENPPELSIIIVNWNVKEHLRTCLEALAGNLLDMSHEVIVVDNASSDDSAVMIREYFGWVKLIENSQNLGFAQASNQGLSLARGTWILWLNPDTQIQPGAVQRMVSLLKNRDEIGLVGPRIINAKGAIVRACRRNPISLWDILKSLFLTDQMLYWLFEKTMGKAFTTWAERPFYASGTTGCLQGSCMLARKRDLDIVGGFDERVPLYLDDGDLCIRFRRKGFLIYYCAEAVLLHHGASSVNKLPNSRMSSLVGSLAFDVYFLKHHSWWHVLAYHLMLLVSSVIFIAVDLVLLLPLFFWKRKFILNYLVKHFWTLIYSLSFCFYTRALPRHWPQSLWTALRRPVQR